MPGVSILGGNTRNGAPSPSQGMEGAEFREDPFRFPKFGHSRTIDRSALDLP